MFFHLDETKGVSSIKAHIGQLLNTRQGSVAHNPTYGLPAWSDWVQDLPENLSFIAQLVRNQIETFEPRIKSVFVKAELSRRIDSIIYLEIQCQLRSHPQHLVCKIDYSSEGLAYLIEDYTVNESQFS